jgi:hypothetical protein
VESALAFLHRFAPDRRSTVANLFLAPLRSGIHQPEQALLYVLGVARRRLQRVGDDQYAWRARVLAHGLVWAIEHRRSEALAYVQGLIERERLSPAEKWRLQEERAAPFKRWAMSAKPATAAQRRLLSRLGYQGEPANRLEASDLITALLRARPEIANEDAR